MRGSAWDIVSFIGKSDEMLGADRDGAPGLVFVSLFEAGLKKLGKGRKGLILY